MIFALFSLWDWESTWCLFCRADYRFMTVRTHKESTGADNHLKEGHARTGRAIQDGAVTNSTSMDDLTDVMVSPAPQCFSSLFYKAFASFFHAFGDVKTLRCVWGESSLNSHTLWLATNPVLFFPAGGSCQVLLKAHFWPTWPAHPGTVGRHEWHPARWRQGPWHSVKHAQAGDGKFG